MPAGAGASLGAARNAGLAAARAPLCLLLDAGHALYPRGLGVLADALDVDPGAAFAYPIQEVIGEPDRFAEAGGDYLLSFLGWEAQRLRRGNYIHAPVLVRTDVLRAVGGVSADDALRGFEDYDLWCRIADRGGRGVLVPQVLARRSESGRSEVLASMHPDAGAPDPRTCRAGAGPAGRGVHAVSVAPQDEVAAVGAVVGVVVGVVGVGAGPRCCAVARGWGGRWWWGRRPVVRRRASGTMTVRWCVVAGAQAVVDEGEFAVAGVQAAELLVGGAGGGEDPAHRAHVVDDARRGVRRARACKMCRGMPSGMAMPAWWMRPSGARSTGPAAAIPAWAL